MKNFFSAIWKAPQSTFAGAIVAALAVLTAADVDLPKSWQVGLLAASAFLSVFSKK
jgi:hypothetical protein